MTAEESRPAEGRPRILVGVDGSEDGLRAVRYAMEAAQAGGADVWIVHALDTAAQVTGLWDIVITPDMLTQAGAAAVADATRVVADFGLPDDRVRAEVVTGFAGEVLGDLSSQAQLLVLGRRSLRGLGRMFVGSTSVAAASRAERPVVVVSAASTPHRTGGLRTVAVAIDTWPVHESALEWGLREAKLRNARLRVVHVVPETLGVEGAQFVSAASAGLGEQLAPFRAAHPDVPIEVEVLLGDPADALVEVSRSVDLLILGERHRRLVLGGPVRAVLAHAHCPVGLIR